MEEGVVEEVVLGGVHAQPDVPRGGLEADEAAWGDGAGGYDGGVGPTS